MLEPKPSTLETPNVSATTISSKRVSNCSNLQLEAENNVDDEFMNPVDKQILSQMTSNYHLFHSFHSHHHHRSTTSSGAQHKKRNYSETTATNNTNNNNNNELGGNSLDASGLCEFGDSEDQEDVDSDDEDDGESEEEDEDEFEEEEEEAARKGRVAMFNDASGSSEYHDEYDYETKDGIRSFNRSNSKKSCVNSSSNRSGMNESSSADASRLSIKMKT